MTAPSCQPSTVGVGQPTTCTVTVTDEGIGESTPTGTVSFARTPRGASAPPRRVRCHQRGRNELLPGDVHGERRWFRQARADRVVWG